MPSERRWIITISCSVSLTPSGYGIRTVTVSEGCTGVTAVVVVSLSPEIVVVTLTKVTSITIFGASAIPAASAASSAFFSISAFLSGSSISSFTKRRLESSVSDGRDTASGMITIGLSSSGIFVAPCPSFSLGTAGVPIAAISSGVTVDSGSKVAVIVLLELVPILTVSAVSEEPSTLYSLKS